MRILDSFSDLGGQNVEITGGIREIHFKSHQGKIVPTFYVKGGYMEFANIKIGTDNIPATLRFIKKELESILIGTHK
jgi:hypothetical protein